MSIGSNVKSRVVNWILAVVERDVDKLNQQINTFTSEAQDLNDHNHLSN